MTSLLTCSAFPVLASFPSPSFTGFELGPLDVRMYGILIATGVFAAATWTRQRYERLGGDGETADRVTVYTIVLAFFGARFAYVLPRYKYFIDNPSETLAIWHGGLALYGGLTVGLIVLLVLLQRWNAHPSVFVDSLAPALPLAQAIGRWGNYFNQELYGTPTTLPWAVEIERPVAPYEAFHTFHPTFLYESIGNVILVAVILYVERKRRLRQGSLIMVYGIGYGIVRFSLELIRTDTVWRFAGLSRNGWVSIVMVAGATAVLLWWQKQNTSVVTTPITEPGTGSASDTSGGDSGDDAEPVNEDDAPTRGSAVLVSVTKGGSGATSDDGKSTDEEE